MKKISVFLILVMLFVSLTACSGAGEKEKSDKPANDPLDQPGGASGDSDEGLSEGSSENDKPTNILYDAFLKTNQLTSLDGTLSILSQVDGEESENECAVTVGYTKDNVFAARIQYAPVATEKGIYFEGNQKYCYGSGRMGSEIYYSERADLISYDIVGSVFSHMMIPTVAVDRMLYFNWSNEFVISDLSYTCEALLTLPHEMTEEAGVKTVSVTATYDSIVKALIPDTNRHANIDAEYQNYDCNLTVGISDKGYISYFEFGYAAADGAELNYSQTRTLSVNKVNEALEMNQPTQVSGPQAKYIDYRCIDGDICYILSAIRGACLGNLHPDRYDSFTAVVIPSVYRFLGEDQITVATAVLKESPCGRNLNRVGVEAKRLTFEKLVIENGLRGKWGGVLEQTQLYVMWEKSENAVQDTYKNVYYLSDWEYADGVPTAK